MQTNDTKGNKMLLNTFNVYAFHAITHELVLMFEKVTNSEVAVLTADLRKMGIDGKVMQNTSIGEMNSKSFYWNED
jgi:hypothetical protein